MRCTAKSKQSGEQCKKDAVAGFEVCHIHGGKTPVGIASPNFKTGRYPRHLPPNLLEAYEYSQTDEELLAVREDIALLDTLLISNLSKLETGESGKAWELMRKAVDEVDKGFANENYGQVMITIRSMRDVIDQKIGQYATEEEIRSKIEQRRKLVESERKRLVEMKQMVSSEQAIVLVTALLESVRRNVNDRHALTAIQSDFIRLTQGANQQRVSAGNDGDE